MRVAAAHTEVGKLYRGYTHPGNEEPCGYTLQRVWPRANHYAGHAPAFQVHSGTCTEDNCPWGTARIVGDWMTVTRHELLLEEVEDG